MSVQMHGPAFDDSGQLVERQVPEIDVKAYEVAGYRRGPLPPAEVQAEAPKQVVTSVPELRRRPGRPPKQAEIKEDADNHS